MWKLRRGWNHVRRWTRILRRLKGSWSRRWLLTLWWSTASSELKNITTPTNHHIPPAHFPPSTQSTQNTTPALTQSTFPRCMTNTTRTSSIKSKARLEPGNRNTFSTLSFWKKRNLNPSRGSLFRRDLKGLLIRGWAAGLVVVVGKCLIMWMLKGWRSRRKISVISFHRLLPLLSKNVRKTLLYQRLGSSTNSSVKQCRKMLGAFRKTLMPFILQNTPQKYQHTTHHRSHLYHSP